MQSLNCSNAVVLDCAVSNISIDYSDGKDAGVRPLPSGVADLPSPGHGQIEWNQDMDDGSLRLVNHGKVLNASVNEDETNVVLTGYTNH